MGGWGGGWSGIEDALDDGEVLALAQVTVLNVEDNHIDSQRF